MRNLKASWMRATHSLVLPAGDGENQAIAAPQRCQLESVRRHQGEGNARDMLPFRERRKMINGDKKPSPSFPSHSSRPSVLLTPAPEPLPSPPPGVTIYPRLCVRKTLPS